MDNLTIRPVQREEYPAVVELIKRVMLEVNIKDYDRDYLLEYVSGTTPPSWPPLPTAPTATSTWAITTAPWPPAGPWPPRRTSPAPRRSARSTSAP